MKKIPNLLSTARICLVPVFVLTYFAEPSGGMKIYAAIVYAIASITDFLDGYIARKYNQITNLGKILDPLGDKLMTLAVLACITIDEVIPVWAVLAALFKEVLMITGGAIIHQKADGIVPQSNIIGKSSTVVFFIVCVTLMLFRNISRTAATAMISVAIGLMLVALASYIMTFAGEMKRLRRGQTEQ